MKRVDKREWYEILWEQLHRRDDVKTAVILSGPYLGARVMWMGETMVGTSEAPAAFWEREVWQKGKIWEPGLRTVRDGEETYAVFAEVLSKQPRLVILGGGHISLPLCAMGKMLDFHVTVMDDRPEFANRTRFAGADEVICDSFSECAGRIKDIPNTYYVIVTRGHLGDSICAEQILRRKCAYVGMIGSRAKVAMTKEKLEKAGILPQRLEELYAPIGLKIGGQTPAEIAVSILAQIIQVKHAESRSCLDTKIGTWLETEREPAVMAQIIEKKGSAPRGAGSRMVITLGGRSFGSVGGGLAEHEVMEEAKHLRNSQVMEFQMDGRESASTGMICGGSIRVLLERL
ncbi:MAG: XdhC family protein [Lachnospiraceae bacterium]|nr:XdhC family protein [Candidatus Fimimorpha excrementavium]